MPSIETIYFTNQKCEDMEKQKRTRKIIEVFVGLQQISTIKGCEAF